MMRNFTLKLTMFAVCLLVSWQAYPGIVVSGNVTDANGNPIEGATLSCDMDVVARSMPGGYFTVELPDDVQWICVKAAGYLPYYAKASGESNIKVVLEKDLEVSTAYFSTPLRSFNGAAASIKGDDITGVPSGFVNNTFTGRLPGLITRQTSGNPGFNSATSYIRGRRTQAEGVLFIIDGHAGSVRDITANEIESVTILKDASAVALYGMRAANGAIVINTKRGESGNMKINFSAQAGYQQFARRFKRLDSPTFAKMYNEAMFNENPDATPKYLDEDIIKYADGSDPIRYPNVNWYDDLLRKGTWLQNYNVDISGGSKVTRYYIALGAQLQSGMFKTDDEFSYSTNTGYQKYNFRSNIDFQVTKTTTVGVGIAMRFERRNYPGNNDSGESNILNALVRTPPNAFPKYYADTGEYVDNTGNKVTGINGKIVAGSSQTSINNPWAMLNRSGYSIGDKRYGIVNVTLEQDLGVVTDGLRLKADVATDIHSEQFIIRNKSFANYELMEDGTMFMRGTSGTMNNSSSGSQNVRNTSLNAGVAYDKKFGKHTMGGYLFYNMYENASDDVLATRYQGIGGIVSYDYDDRYSADFTFSYQGSNKFPSSKRYAFTPAVAAGWVISNEGFMKPLSALSYLKLRGSVGRLASSRGIGYYDYFDALSQVNNVMYEGLGSISGMHGYDETKAGSRNVTWEKSIQWNIGLDAGFFNDRLFVSGDYFRDRRSDIYMTPQSYSYVAGLSVIPKANIGKMKSYGFELSASWNDRVGDLHYGVSANFTKYNNKIVDFDEPLYEYAHMYKKGNSIGDNYGLVANGFFRDAADIASSTLPTFASVSPGDIKYISQTGLPYIDATYDQARIGHGEVPKVFYAANIDLAYKGFDLNVLFQGAAQVGKVLSGPMRNTFVGQGSFFDFQLDRWTGPESVNAAYPRLTTTTNANSDRASSFWYRDASYLRLKSVELGYSFSKPFKGKARIEKLRIFVSGYNLALLYDKVKVIDPEAPGNGSDLPVPRIFNFGVNVSF